MIRRPSKKQAPIAIHARLDPAEHARLTQFADRQDSSVARIVKLAVKGYMAIQAGQTRQTNRVGDDG